MRTFLNLNFKFISRSLVVAAVFFFSFQTTYAIPIINTFTADTGGTNVVQAGGTLQVNNGQGWTIRWQASNTAGCNIDSDESIGSDGLPKWSPVIGGVFSGFQNMDDAGAALLDAEVFQYTIKCYETVRERGTAQQGFPVRNYDVTNPFVGSTLSGSTLTMTGEVSKVITVRVVDQSTSTCPTGASGDICRTVCTGHETTPTCSNCKGSTGTSSGACENAFQCISQNPGNTEQCYISQTESNTATQPAVDSDTGCIPLVGNGFDIKKCTISILDRTLVSLAASFLQLCAYIFEFSIQAGVVQFSSLVSKTGTETAWLTDIWSTIRDILNIAVIFVLLYSAIQVIVGRGGEIKKLIAGVILFGVLTNFSLFLTKAAVDISNVIALEFYQQMRTTPLSDTSFSGGLGATVVTITGLTNLYDPKPEGGISGSLKGSENLLRESILFRLAMIFVFVAVAFVFLQAAFVFIARTLSLILLMIFSPLMFAGGVFAPLQDWIKKWHKEFIGQLTVAPLFMVLLYVVLTVMGSLIKAVNEKLINGENDLFSFLALIILTSALTIFGFGAALSKAKEYSGSIGGKFAGWGSKLSGYGMSKIYSGTLGMAGRGISTGIARASQQTIGRLGEKASKVQGTGLVSTLVRNTGNAVKDKSFDIRNTKAGGAIGGGVSKALSAATGVPVTVSAGPGLKGRETRMKEGVELAQKKADTEIDTELKKIDEGTKQYDIFDQKIVDNTGNELVRTNENNDEWEKKVNVANKYQKGQALAKKNTYLASRPVANRSTSQLKTTAQKAQFKAVKAQQKKLSSETKKEQDHQIRKDKLKAYKDDLKTQFASDASAPLQPPLNNVRVLKSKSEIDAMGDEEVIALWDEIADTISTEMKLYKADKKSIIDNPNQHSIADQREVFRAISDFEKLQKRAGGAGKDIESLKKAIESHEQKK